MSMVAVAIGTSVVGLGGAALSASASRSAANTQAESRIRSR